ncbi:MAG: TRAP transporter small permease subunit [Ostreibacterium sp.]
MLLKLKNIIDSINKAIGYSMATFILLMVLLQFSLVVIRYVFQAGMVFGFPVGYYSSSVMYLHGFSFMLGAAYVLQCNEHVRVDIFYANFSDKKRAWVDLLGTIAFLFTFCGAIIYVSWQPMIQSWQDMEGALEPGQTLPFEFLRKSLPFAFAALMMLQGITILIKSTLVLKGLDSYQNSIKDLREEASYSAHFSEQSTTANKHK